MPPCAFDDLAVFQGLPGIGGLTAIELHGGCIVPDLFVQPVKLVLSFLQATDEFHGPGLIGDLQLEPFQTALAALQGLAAFVSETGDHFADGGQPLRLQRPLLRPADPACVTGKSAARTSGPAAECTFWAAAAVESEPPDVRCPELPFQAARPLTAGGVFPV